MDKLLIFVGLALLYAAYNDNVSLTMANTELLLSDGQFKKLLILYAILLSIVQFAGKNKSLSNGVATIAVLIALSHLLRDKSIFLKSEEKTQ